MAAPGSTAPRWRATRSGRADSGDPMNRSWYDVTGDGEPPVGDVEQRGHGIAGQVAPLRRAHQHAPSASTAAMHTYAAGQQSPHTTGVERAAGRRGRRRSCSCSEQRGDEETREREEHRHAEEAAGQRRRGPRGTPAPPRRPARACRRARADVSGFVATPVDHARTVDHRAQLAWNANWGCSVSETEMEQPQKGIRDESAPEPQVADGSAAADVGHLLLAGAEERHHRAQLARRPPRSGARGRPAAAR